MKPISVSALGLTLLLFGGPLRAADETPAKGKIVAVDLFKNGLAVVKCEVTLGKAGSYLLDDVPQPVHGTCYVERPSPVETSVKMRDVEVPVTEDGRREPAGRSRGQEGDVHFKGGNRPPVVGTMMKMKPVKADECRSPGRFLVLQTAKGRTYVGGGGEWLGRSGERR